MRRNHKRYFIFWSPKPELEFRQLGYYTTRKSKALKIAKSLKKKDPDARLHIYQERKPVLILSVK